MKRMISLLVAAMVFAVAVAAGARGAGAQSNYIDRAQAVASVKGTLLWVGLGQSVYVTDAQTKQWFMRFEVRAPIVSISTSGRRAAIMMNDRYVLVMDVGENGELAANPNELGATFVYKELINASVAGNLIVGIDRAGNLYTQEWVEGQFPNIPPPTKGGGWRLYLPFITMPGGGCIPDINEPGPGATATPGV